MKQLVSNNKLKVMLLVLAVAALVAVWWLQHRSLPLSKSVQSEPPLVKAAPVSISVDGRPVEANQPVAAAVGKSETLALTSKSHDTITVTVPGLQDTPISVAPGQNATLAVSSTTAGTFPIIEHGTMPNTRSVEGGTSQYDMEVGTLEFK